MNTEFDVRVTLNQSPNLPSPRPAESVLTFLVTGHRGFVGSAIASCARTYVPTTWSIATLDDIEDIRDVRLADAIAAIRPDAVLHLAARTNVGESFRDPDDFFDVNFNGTLNLLRSLKRSQFRGRLLYVGSGDCYGSVASDDLPVDEQRPLRPRSPYAVSKIAAEALCFQWSQTEGMDIIIARPFNHIGPGQDDRFVVASLAKQISAAPLGGSTCEIVCGNLDVTRDVTDVRDVVAAYVALVQRGRRGEVYNVGSGREIRIRDLLDRLAALAGVSVQITIDASRLRPDEQLRMCANISKIRRDTGWTPRIPLDDTLLDILRYWKAKEGS